MWLFNRGKKSPISFPIFYPLFLHRITRLDGGFHPRIMDYHSDIDRGRANFSRFAGDFPDLSRLPQSDPFDGSLVVGKWRHLSVFAGEIVVSGFQAPFNQQIPALLGLLRDPFLVGERIALWIRRTSGH